LGTIWERIEWKGHVLLQKMNHLKKASRGEQEGGDEGTKFMYGRDRDRGVGLKSFKDLQIAESMKRTFKKRGIREGRGVPRKMGRRTFAKGAQFGRKKLPFVSVQCGRYIGGSTNLNECPEYERGKDW